MTAPRHPARLLSLSRLVSRSGRGLTGVDRVELAWAEALLADPVPLWGLVRTALGWLLLDRAGVAAVARAARTGEWGRADLLSRLSRLPPERRRGQSLARARAVGRAPPWGLPRLLRRLPGGTRAILVGHADLDDRALGALAARGPVMALVHDTIPLDLPHLQRPGTPRAFRDRLAAVGRHAALVVTPSRAAQADARRHLLALGRLPPTLSAPLGVPVPVPGAVPPELRAATAGPYFVALGTIEPRKNHALLLDLWERWPEAPPLLVLGARGWRNEEVFRRLDGRPRAVHEVAGLPDGAVAALLRDASALLMPSLAEGFGLPALEAAALGTPVICGDLAIFRETLGDRAIACPLGDPYAWERALRDAASGRLGRVPLRPPLWEDHVKAALTAF